MSQLNHPMGGAEHSTSPLLVLESMHLFASLCVRNKTGIRSFNPHSVKKHIPFHVVNVKSTLF